ncbi:MAG TPA: helix-turn-helix transcriptional regulator [Acidimicrobiales bacterium]|jgi:PadR family transcriptional regulator PadR|nr:helix-turn-helix transcriptional regulator [Acidimicrobiales bacterium]
MAPPRGFLLPAILLLLTERPGYGYGLERRLQEFRFGRVDRPAVYRALAQLEEDGLVEGSLPDPTAKQPRRDYRVTPLGERVLRVWMGVVKEEHDTLGEVLRRYHATGTTDAVLAEVEGGWAAALGFGWSSVSSTSHSRRHLALVDEHSRTPPSDRVWPSGILDHSELIPQVFKVVPDRSVMMIEVRSTVGPLSFGATGITGSIEAVIAGGRLRTEWAPSARLEVDVSKLASGNSMYDVELLRRIGARRFPTVTVELSECTPNGPSGLYRLQGNLTFHEVTRPADGTVNVKVTPDQRLVITGEQVFDIRDFAVSSPTVLMFRIYPDVRVRLHAEAELEVEVAE